MSELRLTFSPHDVLGAKRVEKVLLTTAMRVWIKFENEVTPTEYRFDYIRNGFTYHVGESIPEVESCSRRGNRISAHFHLHAGPQQTSVYKDFSTLPIYHYLAEGQTAIKDANLNIVTVVPVANTTLLARQTCPRITFAAHHFLRSAPPAVAPRLFSRHSGLMKDLSNPSTAELREIRRYDNVNNYYRGLIGFLWRECERYIDHGQAVPTLPAPIKTMEEIQALTSSLEYSLMRQHSHAEVGEHAIGLAREDSYVYHWYADHDEAIWTAKFNDHEIWLADEEAAPSELVYDIGAANTDNQDGISLSGIATEEADLFINAFNRAFSSPVRDLGFVDTTIYLP